MPSSPPTAAAGRVLLLPPTTRDADAMSALLAANGIACVVFPSRTALCAALGEDVGAVVISEEAIALGPSELAACLRAQPVWSDLPVIVLSRSGAESPSLARAVAVLGNVSVLERPVRVTTLLSVVRSALRGRARQHEVREHLAELARAAQALSASEQRYRALSSATSNVVYGMSADWSVMLPLDGRNLVSSAAEPVGDWAWLDRNVPADEHPRVRAAIDRAIAGRTLFELEHRVVRPDGSVGWTLSRAVPILDESGRVVEWFGAAEDVTARRLGEAALRTSEENRRLALDAAELGSWHVDPATMRLTTDARFRDIFGVTDEHLDYDAAVALIHPDDQEHVRQAVAAAIRPDDPAPYAVEYRVVLPDGSPRWVFAKGRANFDPDAATRRIVSFDGTVADVTERKTAEVHRERLFEAERAARAEAERAGRMKDEFLATLSHELRTPLNAILGWSQILAGGSRDDSDLAEGLRTIERNARAQTQIIEDLLDMSRIIGGKVRLDVQRIDLAPVVHGAVESIKPAAEAKGIRLQAVLDPMAGPVSGDPNRLQQVMWNLLTNAVKFTPKGGRVQVVVERVNSHLEISVSDTGEGIKPEFLPHVFDRFRQADATTTRRHGGLGLGLAIVKQLVELHGGSIRVNSSGPGTGATFTVLLPLTVVHPQPADEPPRRHPVATVPGVINRDMCLSLAGVRVLVVDDEPDALNLVRRLLEDCEAVVTTAASASEAMRIIQTEVPDVVVSDVGMPNEDGYAFIRQVRALGPQRGGDVPAVALTAYARSEDRMRSVLAGFHMHVAKPVEPAELITIVASLAGRTH